MSPARHKQPEGAVDREKLRAALRELRRDDLLAVLDRALDLVPAARLTKIAKGYIPAEHLRREADLVADVKAFCDASYRGDHYEDFAVNSKNFMDMSPGTEAWIAECERLFERCVVEAKRLPAACVREALAMLIALLRHVDQGNEDVVFFADEGGSWQVGVDWKKVLPVWFGCLSATAGPEEYAKETRSAIDDFVGHDRESFIKKARAQATPEQRKVLRGA